MQTSTLLIGIEPVRHCNLRCGHCLRSDTATKEVLPLALIERLLDEARAYGRPHIALTGGEPTLHPRFFEILDAIKARDYTFHFVTNGTRFSALADRLRGYKPHLESVSFSVDGTTEATHDAIRGEGSYRDVLMAIGVCRYIGLNVTLQMVAMRRNRHEISELPELSRKLGVGSVFVCHAQPTPELYEAGWQLTPDEWREVEAQVKALAARTDNPTLNVSVGSYDPGDPAPCQTLRNKSINIDYKGRLTLCCQLSGVQAHASESDVIADLNTMSLADGHQKFLETVHSVVSERVAAAPSACDLDGFHCWSCQKRFGKVDWMTEYPDDPWVKDDPYFRSRRPRLRIVNDG